ncbi:unnamed protein product [Anisakis simplex]|uniref:Secreted protein n=1 Tax=Anisakis simplex TaxID=6269 RepID=A0A0M3JI01_ANISI|nr:unnamed protein product [Anisakis simplex]
MQHVFPHHAVLFRWVLVMICRECFDGVVDIRVKKIQWKSSKMLSKPKKCVWIGKTISSQSILEMINSDCSSHNSSSLTVQCHS